MYTPISIELSRMLQWANGSFVPVAWPGWKRWCGRDGRIFSLRLRRLTGLAMLLLGLAMVSPLPFSHVLPALVIMLPAFAYLEDDGLVLLIALVGALGTIAVTAATVWGAVATIDWLDPATSAAAAGMVSIGSAGLRPACRADRVERSPAETNGPPATERRRRRPGRRRAPASKRGVRHEP